VNDSFRDSPLRSSLPMADVNRSPSAPANWEPMRWLLLCLGMISQPLFSGGVLAEDEQAWAALREGGKVVLLRHTEVIIRAGIGRLATGNCAAEVNLSPRGIEQAKRLGIAFRVRGIAVGNVLSSPPTCRLNNRPSSN
jgi:hypothetical protein